MPDALVATLVRYLRQGQGQLSRRAIKKFFSELSKKEIKEIEGEYADIFEL